MSSSCFAIHCASCVVYVAYLSSTSPHEVLTRWCEAVPAHDHSRTNLGEGLLYVFGRCFRTEGVFWRTGLLFSVLQSRHAWM